MKIIHAFFLFVLMLCFTGCSDSDEQFDGPENPPEKQEEINPMDAYTPLKSKSNPNKKNLLGKGYDFTGSYLTDAAVKDVSIIDIEKYIEDNPGRYFVMGLFESSNYSVLGADAWEYTKRLTNKSDDYYNGSIPENISAFSGSILDNEMLYDENNLKDFAFASTHFYYYRHIHRLNPLALYYSKDYLSESFKVDLSSLPSKKIIEKYGTHIITSYITGIRLDLIYRSKVEKSDYSTYYTERYVEAGLRNTINKMGYWANGAIDPPADDNVKRNGIPILYIENHGGENSLIPSGVYNLQKGYPKIDIKKWFQESEEEEDALVDLNLDSHLIPIYELIRDEEKQKELKEAVDKYIEERQINFK